MEIASDAAVIDSGTNLIVGPLESVETLFSILGIKHENDELPTVDCESARSFPAITFTIGKLELTLESDYYIVEVSTKCTYTHLHSFAKYINDVFF